MSIHAMANLEYDHNREDRPIVRKLVAPDDTPENADRRTRALAELLETARHPGVVELLRVEPYDQPVGRRLSLILSYADGPTLDEVMLEPGEICGVMSALSTTVADLHDRGLVHGAVSTDHVVLARSTRPVLIGFSQARSIRPSRFPVDANASEAKAHDDVFALATAIRELTGAWRRRATDAIPMPVTSLVRHKTRKAESRVMGRLAARRTVRGANATDRDTADALDRLVSDVLLARPERRVSARKLADLLAAIPGARLPRPTTATTPATTDTSDENSDAASASAVPPPMPGSAVHAPMDDAAIAIPDTPSLPPTVRPSPTGTKRSHRSKLPIVALTGTAAAVLFTGGSLAWKLQGTNTRARLPTTVPATAQSEPLRPVPTSARPRSTPNTTPKPRCTGAAGQPATRWAVLEGGTCISEIEVEGPRIRVGDALFTLGTPNDRVTVGDWDCDGNATPALLERRTGMLYRFDDWPGRTQAFSGKVLGPAPRAVGLSTTRSSRGCDDLLVRREDGSEFVVQSMPAAAAAATTKPRE